MLGADGPNSNAKDALSLGKTDSEGSAEKGPRNEGRMAKGQRWGVTVSQQAVKGRTFKVLRAEQAKTEAGKSKSRARVSPWGQYFNNIKDPVFLVNVSIPHPSLCPPARPWRLIMAQKERRYSRVTTVTIKL